MICIIFYCWGTYIILYTKSWVSNLLLQTFITLLDDIINFVLILLKIFSCDDNRLKSLSDTGINKLILYLIHTFILVKYFLYI